MANPFQNFQFVWTFTAGVDLSDYQFRAVKAGANEGEVIKMATDTDRPMGILQNKPKNGQDATILIEGISYIEPSEDLVYNDMVKMGSDGRADKYEHGTDEGDYRVGYVMVGADASVVTSGSEVKRLGSAMVTFINPLYNDFA